MKIIFVLFKLMLIVCPNLTHEVNAQEKKLPIIKSKPIKSNWTKDTIISQAPKIIAPKNVTKTNKTIPQLEIDHGGKRDSIWYNMFKEKTLEKEKLQYRSLKYGERDKAKAISSKKIMQIHLPMNIGIITPADRAGNPPDNTLAISNSGFIVAGDNRRIFFYKDDGTLLEDFTYADFFDGVSDISAGTSDPKVIYDPHSNRFIYFIQSGNTKSESKILLCFSSSDNPTEPWQVYSFDDHAKKGWFDYPSLAVNDKEIYVTGNLFDGSGVNVIYQLKKSGYSGNRVSGLMWTNIKEASSSRKASSIYALPYGLGSYYHPGIYLVSTEPIENSNINNYADQTFLYDITNYIDNDPVINKYTIHLSDFKDAPFAFQKDTDWRLDLGGDCRIKGGFYLNGRVHFVYSKDIGNRYSGINYVRFSINNLVPSTKLYHSTEDIDYCYPAIASRAGSKKGLRTAIAFLSSAKSHYPRILIKRVRTSMSSHHSEVIMTGDSYRDDGKTEVRNKRWGDYIGIQRKYNSNSIWIMGHIPNSDNKWESYIYRYDF